MMGRQAQGSKYRIAWLPGDGIGVDVLDATRIVLDRLKLDAEYIHGDIGWEFWREEGEAGRLQEELKKTQILCSNCHRRLTTKERGWFRSRK